MQVQELKKIAIPLFSALSFILSTPVLAKEDKHKCFQCLHTGDIYLSVEAGASFSTDTDMDVVSGPNHKVDWDISAQGYDSDLGSSEMLGAGIGYIISPLIALEIEAATRGSFDYEKFQTSPSPTPLGDKTRYFDLESTTVMANVLLSGSGLSGPFSYKSKHFVLDPFVNAGIGVAFNTIDNFHSIQAGTGIPFSLMAETTNTDFAYQLGAGINLRTDRNIGIGLGYRFVDAGDLETNNYTQDSSLGSGGKVIPWEGDVKMNEVYLTLNYYL